MEREDNDLFLKEDNNILNMEYEKEYSLKHKFFAELLGTICLVFVLELDFSTDYLYREYLYMEGPLILVSMMYLFGRISGGHFNPFVSISICLRKKLPISQCICYLCAQIIGGFIGLIFFALTFYEARFNRLSASYIRKPKEFWDYGSCFICLMISAFIYVLVIFGSSTMKENKNISYIIIGITYYLLFNFNFMASYDTLNLAKSFPSAVILAFCKIYDPIKQIWIFIFAPLIGSIAGGFTFMLFE